MKKNIFDELVVVKRSGQRVEFNEMKIAIAIKKAFDSVYKDYDERNVNKVLESVIREIEANYAGRKTIGVENIQDIIESNLNKENFGEVYASFHEYREKRAASRKVFLIKAQHKFVKAMEKIADENYLKADNDLNPNEILLKYGKTVANEFTKSYIIDNKYLRAHEEGNIFIDDMEDFPLGVISQAHLEFDNFISLSNSLNSLIAEILALQDEVNSEINVPSLDYLLTPWLQRQYKYYYKENIENYSRITGFDKYLNIKKILDLIDKENEITDKTQEFQQFIYTEPAVRIFKCAYEDAINKIKEILLWKINKLFLNLNNMQKSGRTISISFATSEARAGKMINDAVLEVLKNIGPLDNLSLIFKVKKGIYESNIETIFNLISKGHNIYFAFIQSDFNKDKLEIEYFANGVRIFENINADTRTSRGRMLVGQTSINMGRLGLKYASKPMKGFYQELDELIDLVKNELLTVFETIGNKSKANYRILFNNNILDDEKLENYGKIRKVIKNGTLNIGLIGLKECVVSLNEDADTQYSLVIDILNYLNKKCKIICNETKLNFCISEPFNSNARKELMALDRAVYGKIKGVTEGLRYGLVSELVQIKNNYEKLSNIQRLFTGGNMISIDLPKQINAKKFSELIKELIAANIGFVKFNIQGMGDSK